MAGANGARAVVDNLDRLTCGIAAVAHQFGTDLRSLRACASSFTFARATWTQSLADFVDAHIHALQAIGGVPALLACDYVAGHIIAGTMIAGTPPRNAIRSTWHAIQSARPSLARALAKI